MATKGQVDNLLKICQTLHKWLSPESNFSAFQVEGHLQFVQPLDKLVALVPLQLAPSFTRVGDALLEITS